MRADIDVDKLLDVILDIESNYGGDFADDSVYNDRIATIYNMLDCFVTPDVRYEVRKRYDKYKTTGFKATR